MTISEHHFLGPTETFRNFSDSLTMLRTDEKPLLNYNQAFSLAGLAFVIFIVGIIVQVGVANMSSYVFKCRLINSPCPWGAGI